MEGKVANYDNIKPRYLENAQSKDTEPQGVYQMIPNVQSQ